jgi:uncharacterized protein (DUF58 family)
MQLSNRAVLLLLIAAIPIAFYRVSPNLLYVSFGYLLVLLGVGTLDYLTSPLFKAIDLIREIDSKFSLGADNLVTIRITNRSRYTLRIHLRDDYPRKSWIASGLVVHEFQIEPRSTHTLTYHLKPLRRGLYSFGDIHLRCWGVLGLIICQRRSPSQAEVKVYPNLLEVRKYELLVRRGMLHEIGLKHSRRFGEGTEIERLREYHPDDDFRRIDWKATSRRHKPIVREFETERSQEVILMLDTGRLMASPIGDLVKLDYAINTSLMTSYVSTLKGDKVGLITFSDMVHQYLPPKPGKKQFHAMLELLYDVRVQWIEPSFENAFAYLASKQRKRALFILFTDILDNESARTLSNYIIQFRRRHLVICVTLSDSNILALAQQPLTDSKSVYQKAIAEKLLHEKQEALEVLVKRGAIALDVPAHQLTMAVINKYLELKAKSRI